MITLTLNVDLAMAKRGAKLDIFPDKILGIVQLPASGTVLIMNGGASLPITESKEVVLNKITEYNNGITPITSKET